MLICGAYGKGNTGDEAILTAILQQMRSLDPDMPVCVMSKNPRRTTMLSNVRSIYTFFQPEVPAGSGKGQAVHQWRRQPDSGCHQHPLFAVLLVYDCQGPQSRLQGDDVWLWRWPGFPADNRRLAARVINRCVNLITLRDPDSARELAGMGVDKPEIQ